MCPPIVDGTPVDAATTNAQKLDKVSDDTAVGKITLANTDAVSGSSVTNLQREHNSAASFMGKVINSSKDDLPQWTENNGFVSDENLFQRVNSISAKFNQTTGHEHTGAAGDAPKINFSNIDGSVTNSQLASMPNNTIKSNISGGDASPSDNSLSAVLDAVVTNTQGSILYRGASSWVPLPPGVSGQFLKTLGPGDDPEWASIVLDPSVFGTMASPREIDASIGITSGAGHMSTSAISQVVFIRGSGGAVNITASPQIEAHTVVGARLVIIGRSNTDTVTLETGDGLDLNGTAVIAESCVLELIWTGLNYIEIARNF